VGSRKHVRLLRGSSRCFTAYVLDYPGGVILVREWKRSRMVNSTLMIPGEFWCEMDWDQRKAMLMSFLSKGKPDYVNAGHNAPPEDSDFADRYPALSEYMTGTRYPDGSKRQVSRLGIFVDTDGWKAQLRDVDRGLVIWATDRSFLGVLEALEGLLISERPPWREDKFAGPSGSNGTKKKT